MPPRLLVVALLALAGTASAQLTLAVTQPTGPGSLSVSVTGASPNSQLFNLFSLVPHSPTGGGPLLGLGLAGSDVVITQILQPLGSPPFHVLATPAGTYDWGFTIVAGGGPCLGVDAVTVEYDPALGIQAVSSVQYVCLAF